MLEQRVGGEHAELLEEVEKLRVKKDELLMALGVQSLEQLPGLVPGQRGEVRKAWNKQFAKG